MCPFSSTLALAVILKRYFQSVSLSLYNHVEMSLMHDESDARTWIRTFVHIQDYVHSKMHFTKIKNVQGKNAHTVVHRI